MSTIDSAAAVKVAFEYLNKVSPNANRFGNYRLEEIKTDENKDYVLVISYDEAGEFGFDRQKQYKQFKIVEDGRVEWMKIYKP
jgi:hypothetical protein